MLTATPPSTIITVFTIARASKISVCYPAAAVALATVAPAATTPLNTEQENKKGRN